MALKDQLPEGFYKLFASKYREYYIRFLLALFQEEKLSRHPMPEGWLIVTLKNLARNERRRWLRHPEVSLEAQAGLAGYSPEAPLDSRLPCQLPADDRRILIWRLEEQLEYREIADRLGISESACRSRLSRAAARCRQYLEGPGGFDGAKK